MNLAVRTPRAVLIAWAALLLLAAALLPLSGTWTIDDSIKRIAAENAPGPWAERVPDGPARAALSNSALAPPFQPPFMQRAAHGFAPGFSPWTRALFKLLRAGGLTLWRFAPPVFAIAFALLLARAGFPWAFLLLPLTFYGLVPWEHTLSWLLLWPALAALCLDAPAKPTPATLTLAGAALALATLLRPETGLLALLLIVWLVSRGLWRSALPLALGGLGGAAAMTALHALTSPQSALVHLSLNFGTTPGANAPAWLPGRALAFHRLFVEMDLFTGPSLLLFALFALAVLLLHRAARQQKKSLMGLAITLLAVWAGLYTWRLWTQPLPMLAIIGQNSLFACLPWTAALFLPPYRNRPLFALALAAMTLALLTAPVWQGIHWGPRILLFAVPLLLLDLYRSGRAKGPLFTALLVLTAFQTLNGAALVAVRRVETASRNTRAAGRLGAVVICRNQHQCADMAPLWPDREFFTAPDPAALRTLLIDLRAARVDTAWLHLDATDSLYVQTFPTAQPVWPYRMTVFTARAPFRSVWRIYELVMNRTDTLWAPLLEAEAGRRLLQKLPADALPLQRDAVALTPLSAQSHHNLALILAALGQTSEARAEVRRALELNPALDASRRLEEMLTSSSATDS